MFIDSSQNSYHVMDSTQLLGFSLVQWFFIRTRSLDLTRYPKFFWIVCLICLMFTTAHLLPVVPLFDLLVSDDLELVAFSTESSQKTIGKNVPSGNSRLCAFPSHCKMHHWMWSCFVTIHSHLLLVFSLCLSNGSSEPSWI